MKPGLYTIINSTINIKVLEVVNVGLNSTRMKVMYTYKSGAVIDFEDVTVPNDALTYWVKLDE
jgi:hypothetical protein